MLCFVLPGGFGSYLLGLNKKTYEMSGVDMEGNVGHKEPGLAWMIGFLFAVSFVGILALVPLRKVGGKLLHTILLLSQVTCKRMIDSTACNLATFLSPTTKFQILVIDYNLIYPSGTATAVLINGFHAAQEDQLAKYVI